MALIHRAAELDIDGGTMGLGRIVTECDIFPDDWFLTCHFIDDQVMPGTLMYEACLQSLRVLLMRKGGSPRWNGDDRGTPRTGKRA